MATFNSAGKGARAGLAMKSNRGFIKQLSKAAEIGSTNRLFIPTFSYVDEYGNKVNDLLIGFGAGRKLDFEVFGTSFMTYARAWMEDENNIPKCKIGCDQFSKISRVILEAQCNSEKEAAKKAADELALANNGQRDETALIRKLDRIDEKYHGRDAEDGAQRTYAQVNQMVGRLDYFMVAEMLIVPMDSVTNTPKWDKAQPTYKQLSNTVIQQLLTIMDTPGFYNPENGYLEVSFKYGNAGQKSKEAGQAATYNGVSADMSLEVAFKDLWAKYGEAKVKEIANGERDIEKANDLILARTGFRPGAFTGADVRSKMLKWVAKNTIILTHIDVTDDITKKAAKDMIKLGIVDNVASIKTKLNEIVEEQGDDDEEDTAPTSAVEETTQEAPTSAVEETAQEAVEAMSPMSQQAQEMINSGAAIGARVGANVPLSANDDDDDLGDLM